MASMNVFKPIVDQKYSSTAPVIVQPATKRVGYVFNAVRTTAGSTDLYTCPEGFKARLVYWNLFNDVNTPISVLVNGKTLQTLPNETAGGITTVIQVTYDDAPLIEAKQTVRFTVNSGATGTSQCNIIVVEENISAA